MTNKSTDLTTGTPRTVLWRFCLPLFASVIFQQFYNIADSFVAGKFIGEHALAAVGNSYEITLIFIAFATGSNMACSVLTSQLFGAKNYSGMKTAISTVMITIAVLCVALMMFGFLSADWFLQFMKTPEGIYADSKLYMDIYIWGVPFLFFYNLSTGIFSAMGDSKTPFVFLAISSVTNIILNLTFVAVLDMGVAGVAWATFLCQGMSCLLGMGTIVRRLHGLSSEEVKDGVASVVKIALFDKTYFRRFTSLAIPSILQQSSISIGTIMIQSSINACGIGVTAGYAAGIKIHNMVVAAFTTLGNGISNFTAQNIGANQLERVKEGRKVGIQMVWMLCVPVVILLVLGAKPLMHLFIDNPTPLALEAGAWFLYICAPPYFLLSVKLVTDGVLRGAGLMKEFAFATTLDLILRVVLVKFLAAPFGHIGIWAAWPIGWVLGTSLSLWFYKKWFNYVSKTH